MAIGWTVFQTFHCPAQTRPLTWQPALRLAEGLEASVGVERPSLARARARWDALLEDLGGDPSAKDWTTFRMLRRDREEDWSDWLAQLLEESTGGRFASELLGGLEGMRRESYATPVVHREAFSEGHRADLVVVWSDKTYTHIEVKVGDEELAKTLKTAETVERRFTGYQRRSDILLLLDKQQPSWRAYCRRDPLSGQRICPVTWLDVARALRMALTERGAESIQWDVWAHAFCGAIEQDLLGFRAERDPMQWARKLSFSRLKIAGDLLGATSTQG